MTESEYKSNFSDPIAAEQFEAQCLSIGREFLPECAQSVLDGNEPTAVYWQWLADQMDRDRD